MYIGITKHEDNPNIRWESGWGYEYNRHFANSIHKYGWNNFTHEIFAKGLDEETAKATEKLLIEYFQTQNPDNGYNRTSGGDGTSNISEESTQRRVESYKRFYKEHPEKAKERSERCKGSNNPMYKKNIKDYMTSENYERWLYHLRNVSDETREKMSKNHADFSGENHYNYGKHLSEETKEKIRRTRKERHKLAGYKNPRARPVYCIELDTIYWGATCAEYETGMSFRSISACCHHRQGCTLSKDKVKFHWCFAEEAIINGYITQDRLNEYMETLI
jgi:hypothetical protein